MPGHGAQVRYSLGTNVNTTFFQVPTLEFGRGAGAREQDLDLVLGRGHRVPVRTQFLFRQSTALFSLLGSCFKMASDWAKWSSYVHSLISDTQSVNTAPFCAGTQALVPEHQVLPSVDSPSPFKIIFSAFESKLNLSYDLFLQDRS